MTRDGTVNPSSRCYVCPPRWRLFIANGKIASSSHFFVTTINVPELPCLSCVITSIPQWSLFKELKEPSAFLALQHISPQQKKWRERNSEDAFSRSRGLAASGATFLSINILGLTGINRRTHHNRAGTGAPIGCQLHHVEVISHRADR